MGLPVLTMELAVGRAGRERGASCAYKALGKPGPASGISTAGSAWRAAVLLMMYYTTVSGWMVDYFFRFLTGSF